MLQKPIQHLELKYTGNNISNDLTKTFVFKFHITRFEAYF